MASLSKWMAEIPENKESSYSSKDYLEKHKTGVGGEA